MKNMISVVIPLYNKAHTIANTLSCVIGQTFQNFEIIIVDDGSTDNGVELIKEKFNDSRIKIISQPNQGVSAARNTGIDNAGGDWISFLDADDLWSINYLEEVDRAILKFPEAKYILGGRRVLNVSDGTSYNFIPANLHGRIEKIQFFQNPHIFAHISASTISKKFLDEKNLRFIPGQKFFEDFTFLFQTALLTVTAFIGSPLVTYCGGIAGQTTSNTNLDIRLKDGFLFRNTVLDKWIQTKKANRLFPVFMRYETRHSLMVLLMSGNIQSIDDFLDGLSADYKNILFNNIELKLYHKRFARYLSISWIKFSKLLWRMHGYPRVNVK